jgi:phosphatidylinositol alpha-1,6-mannosyltransferase
MRYRARVPPRVLLATDSLLPSANGIGRVARLTARVLADLAHRGELQARAISLSDDRAATDLGLPIKAFHGSRARFVLACQTAALGCTHFVYDFAGMARAHPRWMRPRRRSLVWVHGIEIWEQARPDRIRTLARADALVTNTEYTRARADRIHGGFSGATPCWLGTETDDLPAEGPRPSGGDNVLLLGRIDPGGGEKGHRELIECWPAVVHAVPTARLLFAGGGPAESLVRTWVERSPARDYIDLLGFVPEEKLAALWSRTAVFAMPARGEGLGLAYLEAMRHGIPIVASVHDAAPEINLHEVTGYNVDLDQRNDLATRIIQLLRDRQLQERLGSAGRDRWQTHFRYSAFQARFESVLRQFLAR